MIQEYSDEDMAAVGRAFMEAIEQARTSDEWVKNWSPLQCPSEIIFDLINHRDETIARSSERTVDDEMLDRVGFAIEKASSCRAYGMYDYSNYPGISPPHVVRDELTGERLLQTWDRGEVERVYERLKRRRIARAALDALVSSPVGGGDADMA